MSKIQTLALALFAVLALGATVASSAFAEPGEWLINGLAFTGTRNVQTIGLVTEVRLASGGTVLNEMHCEWAFDGTVTQAAAGVKGTDTITELLGELDELITELTGTGAVPLSCIVTFSALALTDCKLNSLASIFLDNLYNESGPWLTELLELEANGLVLDELFGSLRELGKEPGYEVECESELGPVGNELCEGATESDLTNEPTSVLDVFNLEVSGEVECIKGGVTEEKVAGTVGEGLLCIITADLVCSSTEILSVS